MEAQHRQGHCRFTPRWRAKLRKVMMQRAAEPNAIPNRSIARPRQWRCRPRFVLATRELDPAGGARRTRSGTKSRTKRCAAVLQRPPISEPIGPRASAGRPREFGVRATLALLRDLQHGTVHLHGAWMWVTRSCKGGHQCCVTAQRSSVGGGPLNDENKAAAVVGWDD